MKTITTARDIATWIDNTRADVRAEYGAAGVECAVEALRAGDHPAWGTDWSDYLDASTEVVNAAVVARAAKDEEQGHMLNRGVAGGVLVWGCGHTGNESIRDADPEDVSAYPRAARHALAWLAARAAEDAANGNPRCSPFELRGEEWIVVLYADADDADPEVLDADPAVVGYCTLPNENVEDEDEGRDEDEDYKEQVDSDEPYDRR